MPTGRHHPGTLHVTGGADSTLFTSWRQPGVQNGPDFEAHARLPASNSYVVAGDGSDGLNHAEDDHRTTTSTTTRGDHHVGDQSIAETRPLVAALTSRMPTGGTIRRPSRSRRGRLTLFDIVAATWCSKRRDFEAHGSSAAQQLRVVTARRSTRRRRRYVNVTESTTTAGDHHVGTQSMPRTRPLWRR